MSAPALSLRNISCTFKDGRGQRYTAVKDVSLQVADGEFVSIVRPTGRGKCTEDRKFKRPLCPQSTPRRALERCSTRLLERAEAC